MEETLTLLGDEVDTLAAALEDPVIQDNTDSLQRACQDLASKQEEVDKAYRRWQELEDRA